MTVDLFSFPRPFECLNILIEDPNLRIRRRRLIRASVFIVAAGASSLTAPAAMGQPTNPSSLEAGQAGQSEPKARPDLVRQPYSAADVEFMSGMIPHHAQAVLIAGWAASHGARPDEIEFMRNWLRDRGQVVPSATATHHRMKMNGVEHDMLMPGMLSAEQLVALDKARGAEWDRLFLTAMIRHHEGAIKMVDDLFASYGALQDDDVYKFASDMYADQSIEIERMEKMLDGPAKRQP